ncbi:MAG TPA: hypothetical protein VM223_02825 [Planctomycetota bacterium]|nr:hypothetical protein [Planctomycetota bacterium]
MSTTDEATGQPTEWHRAVDIHETKEWRKCLDGLLQGIKGSKRQSREQNLAYTKLQEAIMWLGMDLKALNGGVSCYEEGYNPQSSTVEPTADGLKM